MSDYDSDYDSGTHDPFRDPFEKEKQMERMGCRDGLGPNGDHYIHPGIGGCPSKIGVICPDCFLQYNCEDGVTYRAGGWLKFLLKTNRSIAGKLGKIVSELNREEEMDMYAKENEYRKFDFDCDCWDCGKEDTCGKCLENPHTGLIVCIFEGAILEKDEEKDGPLSEVRESMLKILLKRGASLDDAIGRMSETASGKPSGSDEARILRKAEKSRANVREGRIVREQFAHFPPGITDLVLKF